MSNPTLLRRSVPPSLHPIPGIDESFFVHAPNARVQEIAQLCAAEAVGAIYTMPVGKARDTTFQKTLARSPVTPAPCSPTPIATTAPAACPPAHR